ncbi:MAG: non-canonical purine NTP pyrophosphatase [Candidatus Pacebacteria bacterium]|nr:non-canonical purine NTP pyrophosphatase [Candidatus Paceibacterota bacterium]
MKVVLATRNKNKMDQIRAVFAGAAIEILSLDDVSVSGAAVEDGSSLEENATKKVRYAHERLTQPMWVMADDTGFFIDAFGGEPGIQAAYWGGEHLSAEERMRYALERMHGVTDRRATFRTCVALVSPEGELTYFLGELKGTLLEEPRGTLLPSLPFGVIFLPEGESRSLDELRVEEESVISHRGKAFRQARAFLEKRANTA